MEAKRYAIEQGYLVEENEGKTDIENEKLTSETDIEAGKLTSETDIAEQTRPEFPTQVIKNVYDLIKMNPKVKYSQMEDNLGVTERTISLQTISTVQFSVAITVQISAAGDNEAKVSQQNLVRLRRLSKFGDGFSKWILVIQRDHQVQPETGRCCCTYSSLHRML